MKFHTVTLLTAALASTAVAADNKNNNDKESGLSKYIVVFEKGMETPQKVVDKVEEKLKDLGAFITHEYNTVLKGFAVSAPEDVMGKVKDDPKVQNKQYPFMVEDDQVVSVNDGKSGQKSDV